MIRRDRNDRKQIAPVDHQARAKILHDRANLAKRRKLRKPPKWKYPDGAEMQYRVFMRRVIAEMKRVLKSVVPKLSDVVSERDAERRIDDSSVRLDDWTHTLDNILNVVKIGFDNATNPVVVNSSLFDIGKRTSDYNESQWKQITKAVLGVDVYTPERFLKSHISSFIKENSTLITKLKEETFNDVSRILTSGVRNGDRVEQLKKDILSDSDLEPGRFRKTETRAELIARDQVGKLNGELTLNRQTALGIEKYIWRTVKDERVRGDPSGLYPDAKPSHFDREGKVYSWDSSPDGGHPGEAIQCRCFAEPVFDDEQFGEEEIEEQAPAEPLEKEPAPEQRPEPTPPPAALNVEPEAPGGLFSPALVSSLRDYAEKSIGTTSERLVVIKESTGEVLADYEQNLKLGHGLKYERAPGSGFSNADMFDPKTGKPHPDNSIKSIHTHPEQLSFSDGDWRIFSRSQINEEQIIAPGGKAYKLKKTKEFNAKPWQERTPNKIEEVYNKNLVLAEKSLSGHPLNDEYVEKVLSMASKKTAEELGVEYTEFNITPAGNVAPTYYETEETHKSRALVNDFSNSYRKTHGDISDKYEDARSIKNSAVTAQELHNDALDAEPLLRDAVASAAKAVKGEASFGPENKFAVKSMSSIIEKIEVRHKTAWSISDGVRGTVVVKDLKDVKGAVSTMKKQIEKWGGKVLQVDDKYATPIMDSGYVGVHVDVLFKTKTGRLIKGEIQIHNGEMEVKEISEKLYQSVRTKKVVPEAIKNQSRELFAPFMKKNLG